MESINFLTLPLVFGAGLTSFFSPCVLPLIPLYLSYLSGNTVRTVDNQFIFDRKKVIINTIFFILGISTSFFILAYSFSYLGELANNYKNIISTISGIIIIILGLFQLNIIKLNSLNKERKIDYTSYKSMNIFVAYILGFTFSFAWTPCVGPILASVLFSTFGSPQIVTNLIIFVYSLGFLIPFLLLGIFTTTVLNFFKSKMGLTEKIKKIGGIILLVLGFIYLSNTTVFAADSPTNKSNINYKPRFDFELKDQNGITHKLSDYKGKIVIINFWATWCHYCVLELDDLKKLFKERGYNKEDVVLLSVTNPKSSKYPYAADEDVDYIKNFIKKKNITYPVLFDMTGEQFYKFKINAFPTTFIIGRDGSILTYLSGQLPKKNVDKFLDMQIKK